MPGKLLKHNETMRISYESLGGPSGRPRQHRRSSIKLNETGDLDVPSLHCSSVNTPSSMSAQALPVPLPPTLMCSIHGVVVFSSGAEASLCSRMSIVWL